MEAFAALFGAFFEALFALFAAVLEVVASLLAMGAEFLFYLVFHGRAKAKERLAERKLQRDEKKSEQVNGGSDSATSKGSGEVTKGQLVGALVAALIAISVISYFAYRYQLRKSRVEHSKRAVERVLSEFATDLQRGLKKRVAGPQLELDGWNRPVELLVDDFVVGKLVVVRSLGPNQRVGGNDDIMESKFVRAKGKQVAGKLFDLGADAIQAKVKAMIDRADAKE